MMMRPRIDSDERTVAVANASFRWGYLFLSCAILVSIAYRSFRLDQTSWDLLAIVILGGVVTTAYQQSLRILSRRSVAVGFFVFALALAAAAIISLTS
jgi:hypothetical protein